MATIYAHAGQRSDTVARALEQRRMIERAEWMLMQKSAGEDTLAPQAKSLDDNSSTRPMSVMAVLRAALFARRRRVPRTLLAGSEISVLRSVCHVYQWKRPRAEVAALIIDLQGKRKDFGVTARGNVLCEERRRERFVKLKYVSLSSLFNLILLFEIRIARDFL